MPETLVGKYMVATIEPPEKGRKTRPYRIREASTGNTLGFLRWYGPWRGYCFFPITGTVFDGGCMAQLISWMNDLNAAHKRSKEAPDVD